MCRSSTKPPSCSASTTSRIAAAERTKAIERGFELDYAREVAQTSGSGMVTADALLERYAGSVARASVSDAAGDRTWVFGHVVVDEAQELSPMAWRVVVRRCPSRSMTVVGDVNQTGSPAGVTDWAELFDAVAPDRWSMELLTVNYRTPRPVMELAVEHLRSVGIPAPVVTSARDGAEPVRLTLGSASDLGALVRSELDSVGAGRIAVISSAADQAGTAAVLSGALPGLVGVGDDAVDSQVAVLTPALSKGLEFDVVIVVNAELVAEAPGSGARDLYVAYTRTTSRLVLVTIVTT